VIGTPILVVFLTFVARSALSGRRVPSGRPRRIAIGAGAVALLLAMDGRGFDAARRMTAGLPFWKGTATVGPLLSQCGPTSVHVNLPPPLFAVAGHAPASTFVDAAIAPPARADNPHPDCPVLGWAENLKNGDDFMATASDGQLLELLGIAVPLVDVTILRHRTGYVVLRAQG
jgi:hypothetical protein